MIQVMPSPRNARMAEPGKAEIMKHYTVYDDPRVDAAVAADLDLIVKKLTGIFPLRAIILAGGFGRGEGSVLLEPAEVRPVNDYDLVLVVPDDFAADLRPLARELAQATNIRLIDLIPLKYSALAALPATQFNYDLKYGSRPLWGEDALALIPSYAQGMVEPESIRTLLLNRLVCAVEAYSEIFAQRALTAAESFFLVNQTGKIVSACAEALLMNRGAYHPSYRERRKILAREFPEKAELLRLLDRATEFKLRPAATVDFDQVAYWHDAVRVYLAVMAELLAPAPGAKDAAGELWRVLSAGGASPPLTNNAVERIELMLLVWREAPVEARPLILARAHAEFAKLTSAPLPDAGWESLRAGTTRLWHEICH